MSNHTDSWLELLGPPTESPSAKQARELLVAHLQMISKLLAPKKIEEVLHPRADFLGFLSIDLWNGGSVTESPNKHVYYDDLRKKANTGFIYRECAMDLFLLLTPDVEKEELFNICAQDSLKMKYMKDWMQRYPEHVDGILAGIAKRGNPTLLNKYLKLASPAEQFDGLQFLQELPGNHKKGIATYQKCIKPVGVSILESENKELSTESALTAVDCILNSMSNSKVKGAYCPKPSNELFSGINSLLHTALAKDVGSCSKLLDTALKLDDEHLFTYLLKQGVKPTKETQYQMPQHAFQSKNLRWLELWAAMPGENMWEDVIDVLPIHQLGKAELKEIGEIVHKAEPCPDFNKLVTLTKALKPELKADVLEAWRELTPDASMDNISAGDIEVEIELN